MKAGAHFAWLQLFKSKGHFAAAVSGVTFAVVLMFGQLGLRDSLLDSSTRLYDHLNGDIVMTGWQYRSSQAASSFAKVRVAQALSVPGVQSCAPVELSLVQLENEVTRVNHIIQLVAFDPADRAFLFKGSEQAFANLRRDDAIIFDKGSREGFGPIAQRFEKDGNTSATVSNQRLDVIGLVELGPGFVTDGTIFSSDVTQRSLVGGNSMALPSLGVIHVAPGADVADVLQRLRAAMPNDVQFRTVPQFKTDEQAYWLEAEPIGVVFTSFLVLGVVVGAVVVYQILYSDVKNHLPEYATMKAMGFTQLALYRIVVTQAIFISVLGFVPGAIVAEGIYVALGHATLLPFLMTPWKMALVYGLTLMMCVGSAAIAMQALRKADPAEIF